MCGGRGGAEVLVGLREVNCVRAKEGRIKPVEGVSAQSFREELGTRRNCKVWKNLRSVVET